VTLGQVGDILSVCRKLYRAEDGALGHAAVYGEAFSLVPIVEEWLSFIPDRLIATYFRDNCVKYEVMLVI